MKIKLVVVVALFTSLSLREGRGGGFDCPLSLTLYRFLSFYVWRLSHPFDTSSLFSLLLPLT